MAWRTKQDMLFGPLAQGLSQQEWAIPDIRHHLEQRLPNHLKKTARALAQDLKQAFPAAKAPDAARLLRYLKGTPKTAPLMAHVKQTGAYPDPPTQPPRFRPVPALADLGLPVLATPDALADWLSLPSLQLTRFADGLGLSARSASPFAPHYRHHLIAKRNGTLRLIEEPKPFLKHLQRKILRGILAPVPPHSSAFGFCTGKSCPQAAARHAGEAMVVSFDLSGFFPSIHQHRVYGLFRSLGYPSAVARHLSGLTTAITPRHVLATPELADRDHLTSRHLPQGAPTSPALANLVGFSLDTRLAGLARSLEATYTRYADDLTFSGDHHIANILQQAVPQIVRDSGFVLNSAKTRVQPAHRRQRVTGLVVNRHLNLPRADYDHLKAVIHHLRTPTDPRRADRAFIDRIAGRIAWLEQVNPPKGAKLRERLADALQAGSIR
ncbi:reverse transcriptase family protein [uncultured Roseovarius sp.]|uniref:reverse transcriptase family protein n=1 Tax=uncultured Roseovarius sp. TaxID=293344 RepID=UPI0026311511|nr:reverse transcriptase family protein [uncultured Roseovarius sp.]